MHKLMKVAAVRRHMSAIVEHDVSRVARDPGGFLHEYLRVGPSMLDEIAPGGRITWRQKRTNFIRRHLAQYKTHRTERRRLALIAWAYDPR
jgi:hypothetical protein